MEYRKQRRVAFHKIHACVPGLFGPADLATVVEIDTAFGAALAAGGTAEKCSEKMLWDVYSGHRANPVHDVQ